jgi:putative membrane protein
MLLSSGSKVPKQMASVVVEVEKKTSILGMVVGFLGVSVLSVIPAIGPTQASLLASEFRDKRNYKEFLISIGGINTADVIFSILALWTIGKPRSGAIAVASEIMGTFSFDFLYTILLACLISGVLGYFLMMVVGSFVVKRVHKINYGKLKYVVVGFVSFLTFVLDPVLGIVVLAFSTAVGHFAERYDVNKSHCRGCLIIPTILYYIR